MAAAEAGRGKRLSLAVGLAALGLVVVLPPPPGLSEAGWRVLGVATLMAIWWTWETLPVPVTALVPLAAFPLLGILPAKAAAAPYADPLVFFFMGGFLLAQAIQRWNLHRRLALMLILKVGEHPERLVFGFMLATALLSMWVSNTATAVLMMPLGLSVIAVFASHVVDDRDLRNFAVCVVLGIAYASSIGGVATLIGTPPNALTAAYFARELGQPIAFADWLVIGLPIAALLLPLAWLVLVRLLFPFSLHESGQASAGSDALRTELRALGPIGTADRRVLVVFAAMALGWVLRPLLQDLLPAEARLTDMGIAILGALALFAIPSGTGRALLSWEEALRLPWGVLLLVGGGLSLAEAIGGSDLAPWLAAGLEGLARLPAPLFAGLVALLVAALTQVTSNTATVAALLPVLASLAPLANMPPLALAAPAALAASCAFVLPVATPPNAVAFATGQVTMAQMVRAGQVLTACAVLLITLLCQVTLRVAA